MLCFTKSYAQNKFNGIDTHLGNLYRLSDAQTRSISPENYTGEKGKGGMAKPEDKDKPNTANAFHSARDLGQGWKVNPLIRLNPGDKFTLAEIEGPGAIQHIWMTPTGNWRFSIIRIYWDDETEPSVECPIGDFFGMGWCEYAPLLSLPVCVNPGSAFNSYWVMPFRKKCKITIENLSQADLMKLFYQIDYALTNIADDAAYFHAQFRRTNPNITSNYTIIDNVKGFADRKLYTFALANLRGVVVSALTPEQRKAVDEIKANIEKAMGKEAYEAAVKAMGGFPQSAE